MNLFDISCRHCGTTFAIAESAKEHGNEFALECSVCGEILARFDDDRLRVARVMVPAATAYFHVPADAPEPLGASLH
jgi:uncharacterized Zn finger protein